MSTAFAFVRACGLGLTTAAALWIGTFAVFAQSASGIRVIALASLGMLISQIGVLLCVGRTLFKDNSFFETWDHEASSDLLSEIALRTTAHTLSAAFLVSSLFLVFGSFALGVPPTELIPRSLVPLGLTQLIFSFSTFISVRGLLRRLAAERGSPYMALSPRLIRVLTGLTFLVPVPLAVTLLVSSAGQLYCTHATEYQQARLLAQIQGVRQTADANASSGPPMASPPCQGLPVPISFGLVFVAILASGIAATRVFLIMTRARRQLSARLDALPERLIKAPFHSPFRELEYFDSLLARLKARFDEMRSRQRRNIETGRKDRELKAQFFAGMSHDLRSPLNSIIGFTDLLLGGIEGELTPEQKQAIVSVSNESEKLMSLITDILDSSKLDAGRFDLDRTWVPPVEIISVCTAEARRMLEAKHIEITPAVQAGLAPVYVDKSRIQQALIGLLTRATQNAHSGAFRIKATSERAATGQHMLRIDIVDVAVTLSNTERILIGEAVDSAASIPARSGTGALGLGIALARDIIHLHHGELVVHRSGGIVFSVRLPLDEVHA
jgi:signal transduction histidine kinase